MFRRSLLAVPALAAVLLAPPALAQDATPAGGSDGMAVAHPAHIHAGTCADLGDVVIPLPDVAVPAGGEASGAASALPIAASRTVVDVPFRDIVEGGHAVNVHLSADEIGTYIACGDIGGVVTTDEGGRQEMMIGLAELNDSGYAGTVWIGPSADGTQTEFSVILLEPAAMS
jgi:hypothetical protein